MKYDENKLKELCEKHNVEYVGVITKEKKSGKKERYIQFICPLHERFGVQEKTVYDFKRFKHVCKYCNHTNLKDVFQEEVSKANPSVKVLSEYTKWFNKVECECLKCGNIWHARPSVILYGGGCPKCGREKANKSEMLNFEDVKQRIENANNNIEVIGEYHGYHSYIKCRCKIDGTIWESPVSHLIAKNSSCPTCNTSKGELKLIEILKNLGYNVETQYIFDDCKYIKPLKYDAYVSEINTAFEYQGEQHYFPVNFSGKGDEWAKEQFEINQTRDNIKRKYCEDNNIPLIEIPYWEFDNMEYFLLSKIKGD